MTLGMSKRNISMILMLETSFMAGMALVTGLLLGIFGSQMMSVLPQKYLRLIFLHIDLYLHPMPQLKV